MIKYDLPMLGYDYRGVASSKKYYTYEGNGDDWRIIDIPKEVPIEDAKKFVNNFINGILALEIPSSLVCNLRCNYCYISDPRMKNIKVTSEQIIRILENASSSFPGLSKSEKIRKSVNKHKQDKAVAYISPWGAEPFANLDTLEAIYGFAHEYYGKDNYRVGTSTNGTILNDRVKNLFNNFIDDEAFNSIQISLDGPRELQDYQRPFVNGNGSFDRIEQFCKFLIDLQKEKNINNRLYSFCSTIHLIEDDFVKNWTNAAEFFSTPNEWFSNLPCLPMRMSGEDLSNKEHINKFINAQQNLLEVVKKRAREGITVYDFYTAKLFESLSCKSLNAFPYCSALNTQIAADVDGSLYPCHGPVTSPLYKPFLWIGNLFDKTISYKMLYRNLNYQYGILWSQGKCEKCPVHKYTKGSICWSCPPHNLALTGEPSMDSPLKCIAYAESLKYWIAIAKITMNEKTILHKIPVDWFNDIELDYSEFKNKKINVDIPKEVHFDLQYNGIIDKALQKYNVDESKRIDYGNLEYITSWWEFDNFNDYKK